MLDYFTNYRNAKYGLFIHWGVYSIIGRGEWAMYTNAIPREEYRKLADEFNPQDFTPRAWAKLARKAGMKYMVMTTKHHDGFCLFDSKHTDFTSVKTAAKRDFVKEYVEACRAEGLLVGLYFSAKDWQWKEYFHGPEKDPEGWQRFIKFYCDQVKELCTNYGKIDIFWFDGGDQAHFAQSPEYSYLHWNSNELEAWMRQAQPGIMINGRSSMRADFHTLEKMGYPTRNPSPLVFELCDTLSSSWGFRFNDPAKNVFDVFTNIMTAASNASNLLLNVSPDRNGKIPADQVAVLEEIGDWLSRNSEAFFGAERILPAWWEMLDCGSVATKENYAYLYLMKYPVDRRLCFWKLGNKVLSASILSTGKKLEIEEDRGRTIISGLPAKSPEKLATVIKMKLDGPARPGEPEALFS